jgi:hypothetical protein
VLWSAGQARIRRESRERRAELYQAGRDAYVDGNIATGKAKPRGSHRLPEYLRAERDPGDARRGLRQLAQYAGRRLGRGESAAAMRAASLSQVRDEEAVH